MDLRPRKSRVNYASITNYDDEAQNADADDLQTNLNQDEDAEPILSDISTHEDENLGEDSINTNDMGIEKRTRKRMRSAKGMKNVSANKGVSYTHTTPWPPSYDHRHKAVPLYWRAARVERLLEKPTPFSESKTCITNNWMSSRNILDRLGRASGRNFGPGPIWEYMEDRSWWKESEEPSEGEAETENTRRPRVFGSIKVDATLTVIKEHEAQVYLPCDKNGIRPSSIKCHFGYPVKDSTKELTIFESLRMSELLPESKAQVFNAGGPVWGLDWCPIYVEDQPRRSYKQYIAVSPLPSVSHSPQIGVRCVTPTPACIQIWSYSSCLSSNLHSEKGKEKATSEEVDNGSMKCELVLCIDLGPAQEIKWCPLPSHDSWENAPLNKVRKLGLLAGTFEDGSMSIFAIPDPEDLQSSANNGPIYVKTSPLLRFSLEETSIWCLDWANSERIAVGCTNGALAVYDIIDALSQKQVMDFLPTHYLPSVNQSAIRSVAWIRTPNTSAEGRLLFKDDPNLLSTGGYDGCVMVVDLNDGSSYLINNRTRDVIYSVAYSSFSVGVVTTDLDFTVKSFFLVPSMLGKGHIVMEAAGPVWDIHTSDYHPHVATAAADGSVQTTNMLRSTRRAPTMPFLFHKIYQMDYSRKTGVYRMLDQFLPQEIPDRSGFAKKKRKNDSESDIPQGTGGWPAEVSVTRVVWNNGCGIGRAPLLASATASGLCRIDWLLGYFLEDVNPYNGVQYIRNEVESLESNEMDLDGHE